MKQMKIKKSDLNELIITCIMHEHWIAFIINSLFQMLNMIDWYFQISKIKNHLNFISLQYFLIKMTEFWHQQLLFFFRNLILASLYNLKLLQCNNQYDDFTFIQWKTLLIEDDDFLSSFNLQSSKKYFLAFCKFVLWAYQD